MYKETTDLERTALFIAMMEAQKRDRIAQLSQKHLQNCRSGLLRLFIHTMMFQMLFCIAVYKVITFTTLLLLFHAQLLSIFTGSAFNFTY